MSRIALVLTVFFALEVTATAQVTSVPPATMPASPASNAKAARGLLLPDAPASRSIDLAAPSAAELAQFKAKREAAAARRGTPKAPRLAIGFPRPLPPEAAAIPLGTLDWRTLDNGTRVARIDFTSPTAAAIRVALVFHSAPSGMTLRFADQSGNVHGPSNATDFSTTPARWSPVLDGEKAIVELALPAGSTLDGATLTLAGLSHLVVSDTSLKQADPLRAIGTSGSCEVDVVCLDATTQQQAASAINATARIVLTDAGSTYLCTGTLVNNSTGSLTPYFYTANHCIDNDDADPAASRGQPYAVAQTFQTYWFFRTNACNVHTSSSVNFALVTGGATLLGRSVDFDWALVRLNDTPPAGATFAAWNSAGPLAVGTNVLGLHHPEGDLEKASQGATRPYDNYPDGSSFIAVRWSQGVTEPGSSGSGLFTLNTASNFYEFRGALFGGESACNDPSGIDDYSRLDVAIPLLAQYLAPNPNAASTPAVEFYNAALDDYFLTANPQEIGDLDSGAHPGWVRTGLRFLVYTNPATAPVDAQPVCRYYVAPAFGDSHFYSADPAECTATGQKFANQWIFESAAVFYIEVPDKTTGACPSGTHAVFRFLNNANGLHHRYTAEVDVRDSIIADRGWTQEGYGTPPNQVVMCSPNA